MSTIFVLPDGFTVTDAEFAESKREQEQVYSQEGGRQAGRTYLDPLGHARWDTDYVTLRMSGYTHQAALQEVRVRIRAAWNPPLPNSEPHPPVPPPTPLPPGTGGGGLQLGTGATRTPYAGAKLPLPTYGEALNRALAQMCTGLLRTSCQDEFGPAGWAYLNLLVDCLRTYDTRWGFNGKRGNANDPSKDVVTYHYGDGPDENSTDVYIIDVVGGHCGPTPSAIWNDVTQVTIDSGTIGRWISRGRF